MTKEEYLILRNNNSPSLLYVYYCEKFDKEKHKQLLTEEEFFQFLRLWMNPIIIKQAIIEELDIKFNVTKMFNKNNDLIKIF